MSLREETPARFCRREEPSKPGAHQKNPRPLRTFEELRPEKEPTPTRPSSRAAPTRGDYLEVHETVLEPRRDPPTHHHVGEEMFLIIGGTVEITSCKATRLGPGSSAFVAANEEHGLRNAGSGPAHTS